MRDRLIELMRDRCDYTHCLGKKDLSICINQCSRVSEIVDHLLSEGVIVLPCKVGSTIYRIDYREQRCSHENQSYDGYYCGECSHLELGYCDYRREVPYIYEIRNADAQAILGNEHLLGIRAFLTREEAEKALAERSANET